MDGQPDSESVRKKKKRAGITQPYRVIVTALTSSFNGAGARLKEFGTHIRHKYVEAILSDGRMRMQLKWDTVLIPKRRCRRNELRFKL